MKTNLKRTGLFATLALTALGMSVPAFADPAASNTYATQGSRAHQTMMPRDRYARNSRYDQRRYMNSRWNNQTRIQPMSYEYGIPNSWRRVPGKIVQIGQGAYSDCFRVLRKGSYRGDPAVVTVRYCENDYGAPVKMRGTKQLIQYTRPMYSNY